MARKQRDTDPAILQTVRTHDGKVFSPGEEDELIAHGLTDDHIDDLEARGVLANFAGHGVAPEKAKGTPRVEAQAAGETAAAPQRPARPSKSEPALADLPHKQDVTGAAKPGAAVGKAAKPDARK